MEFLRSLLRRRFARGQVATLRNVGCFFRVEKYLTGFKLDVKTWISTVI